MPAETKTKHVLRCSNEQCETRTDDIPVFFNVTLSVDEEGEVSEDEAGSNLAHAVREAWPVDHIECCSCGGTAERVPVAS